MFDFKTKKQDPASQNNSSPTGINGYVSPYSNPANTYTPASANPLPISAPTNELQNQYLTTQASADNLLNDPSTLNQVYANDPQPQISQIPTTPAALEAQIPEPMPTVSEIAGPEITPIEMQNPSSQEPLLQVSQQFDLSNIATLLDLVIQKGASDLHLTVGYPVSLRIDSKLERFGEILTEEQVKTLIYQTLTDSQRELLEVNKEVDLSYAHEGKARFRVNAYNERGNFAAAYRLIPTKIRSLEELGLPPVLYDFTKIPQGLFLVTGPTGSGKSTTLAAMIQEINNNYPKHIITIEDPIEYVHAQSRALIDQRELGSDTHDWNIALRSILRQDPDVVLIGEMRDFETIQAAITIAETGHLVYATLHTNSAAQSVDRIIDVFPPHQQEQIRTQLSGSLKGILSQRLIPKLGGGREAAIELMIVNSAIQNLIREGKTYQIDNIISTSFDIGMTTLERSLVKMIRQGKISVERAQEYAIRPEEVLKLMKTGV
jgi:twitching motility protein PilT